MKAHTIRAALIVAPLLLVVAGVMAQAQTMPTGPVAITSCTVLGTPATQHRYVYNPAMATGVEIAYVNQSATAATPTTFEVRYNGRVEKIVDGGTLLSNKAVVHRFNAFRGIPYTGSQPQSCAVTQVAFADGTMWPSTPVANK